MDKFYINNLFLATGLYRELAFPEHYQTVFYNLFIENNGLQFDAFCIHCEKDSTFKLSNKYVDNEHTNNYSQARVANEESLYWNSFKKPITLTFSCQRSHVHKYSIMFITHNDKLIKVGQVPAIASIEQHSIKKYRKVLEKDYMDFSKSIGLASHGVGIGSFVYLRRIFENLIEENHIKAQSLSDWNEDQYIRSRMNEKIELLREFLPAILVETKNLYGIISKGIHELDEQECLQMFPSIKLAIELILDEKIHKIEQQQKAINIKKFTESKFSELQNR